MPKTMLAIGSPIKTLVETGAGIVIKLSPLEESWLAPPVAIGLQDICCSICKRPFATKSGLDSHQKNYHKNT